MLKKPPEGGFLMEKNMTKLNKTFTLVNVDTNEIVEVEELIDTQINDGAVHVTIHNYSWYTSQNDRITPYNKAHTQFICNDYDPPKLFEVLLS